MGDALAILSLVAMVTCVTAHPSGPHVASSTLIHLQRSQHLMEACIFNHSSQKTGSDHMDRLHMSRTYLLEAMEAYGCHRMEDFVLQLTASKQLLYDAIARFRRWWTRADLNRLLDAKVIIKDTLDKYTNKTKSDLERCDSLVDIAIIGGGVSGTYSAYRLRNNMKNIALYEYSNRIGGRMFTATLPDGMKVEFGGMRFHPAVHKKWVKLATLLNLTMVPFEGAPEHNDIYNVNYFRGTRRRRSQTNKVGDFPGYPVRPSEKNLNYDQLHWMILNRSVDLSMYGDIDPFDYMTRDGKKLRNIGMWNLITKHASSGVRDFLQAWFPYDNEYMNGNSAHRGIVDNPKDVEKESQKRKVYTLEEGMAAVPQKLLDEFLKASKRHSLHMNRLLKGIKKVGNRLQLHFVKTNTFSGTTTETKEKEVVCAKKILLGISARSIEILDWKPLKENKQIKSDLKSHRGTPALKAYLSYDKPWWRYLEAVRWVVTDLPTRQSMEFKVLPDGSALLLASYSAGEYTEFWEGLTKYSEPIKGNFPNQYNVTEDMLDQMNTFIAESMGIKKSDIPAPRCAGIHIWKSDPLGYAWYSLRAGYDWREVRDRMAKPDKDHEVYVVSTFGNGEHSQWGDGGVQVADYALKKYFDKTPL